MSVPLAARSNKVHSYEGIQGEICGNTITFHIKSPVFLILGLCQHFTSVWWATECAFQSFQTKGFVFFWIVIITHILIVLVTDRSSHIIVFVKDLWSEKGNSTLCWRKRVQYLYLSTVPNKNFLPNAGVELHLFYDVKHVLVSRKLFYCKWQSALKMYMLSKTAYRHLIPALQASVFIYVKYLSAILTSPSKTFYNFITWQ